VKLSQNTTEWPGVDPTFNRAIRLSPSDARKGRLDGPTYSTVPRPGERSRGSMTQCLRDGGFLEAASAISEEVQMRLLMTACFYALAASSASAQQAVAPTPDLTKAAYVSAADLASLIAKQPADRNGTINRLLQSPPYAVNIEHRVPVPQSASVHETEAEMFYVLDGAATLVTGGTLIEPTRTGANLASTKGVEGGVSQRLGKGDFVMVPAGVPHWFKDIQGSLTQISLHLPATPPAK
jgi:mannose-6-phosphate isomerase-like protein (cupin superfamily)